MGERLERAGDGRPLPSVSEVARENSDPFRVLVATMISLRTKDEVTRVASAALLSAAPGPEALAALPTSRIEKLIYPAGFYRTKARSLRAAARILMEKHAGKVPPEMEQLLALPGVGRKTANLVRNLGFGLPGHLRGHPRAPHLQPNGLGDHACARPDRGSTHGNPAPPLLDLDQRAAGAVRPVGLYARFPLVQRLPGVAVVRARRRREVAVKVTAGIIEENGMVLHRAAEAGKAHGGKVGVPRRQDRAGGKPRAVAGP